MRKRAVVAGGVANTEQSGEAPCL